MSEPEPSRPGSILRAEREALGVSVREVSETLNLSIAVIEAIEADDHARLPGPVFARGYVRAYARLLELEPEPLVAQYPKPRDPTPSAGAPSEPPIWEWIRRRPALVLGGAAAAVVLLLTLLVIWVWPDGAAERTGSELPAAESGDPRLPAGDPFADDNAAAGDPSAGGAPSETLTGWPADAEEAGFTDAGDAAGASGAREPEAAGASPSVAPAVAPGGADVRRITELGDDRLVFAFTDDCWVEVRSASGGNLYSALGRGGSELVLVGQAPFRILLGYAPGVELSFNGEPMPLAPHTRNNVATLVLGQ